MKFFRLGLAGLTVVAVAGCAVSKPVPVAPILPSGSQTARTPSEPPRAAPAGVQQLDGIQIGMTCVVPDGWWSLDAKRPEQPEPIKVMSFRSLPDGSRGVWVQPMRGALTGHQYQIAFSRLTQCHAA